LLLAQALRCDENHIRFLDEKSRTPRCYALVRQRDFSKKLIDFLSHLRGALTAIIWALAFLNTLFQIL